ncbi:MAG: MFS transporter, partial [Parvibaculales bacterium]
MNRSMPIVFFILCIWFVVSFVTNILGPLTPIIIENFSLSYKMASFLPFSFFLAYGLASIPAGALIERLGMKKALLIAFGLNFVGAFAFALFPVYLVALASLFTIGVGMAMTQVVINPLMRTAGGEENFAFFSVMGQLVFGFASFVSPAVFTYLMVSIPNKAAQNPLVGFLDVLTPDRLPWVALYWVFGFAFFVMIAVVMRTRLPKAELAEDEKTGSFDVYVALFKERYVQAFFLGLICYVGLEQGATIWMSEFLSVYHGVDPKTLGAASVGKFWGLMSLGCLVGLGLLKLVDSKVLLRFACGLAALCLVFAVFGSESQALFCFPMIGFFISIMFSIIFSLALNSAKEHHGAFSGILCTGIFGGALMPFIMGV